jgi:hypothetical protein
LFFGALPAFRAEGIRMHAESLSDAGTEAIGLNECTHKSANVVNTGALDEVAEGLDAGLAGAHLKIHEMEFVAEVRVRVVEILAYAHQGLIESESGLDADDGKVKGVGQSEADAVLALANHALQDEAGKQEAESGDAREHRHIADAEDHEHREKSDASHQHAHTEVVVDVDGIAVSGLNEPFAGAGDIGRRKRDGFAEWIESLFDAITDGGLDLGDLRLRSAESTQTSTEHRAGTEHGRAEGEDRHGDGDEYDNGQN